MGISAIPFQNLVTLEPIMECGHQERTRLSPEPVEHALRFDDEHAEQVSHVDLLVELRFLVSDVRQ